MKEDRDYYHDYKNFLKEIEDLTKSIKTELGNFKQKISKNNTNTISEEKDIEEMLKKQNKLINELVVAYDGQNAPIEIPGDEIDKRNKEIQQLSINNVELNGQFHILRNKKYKYTDEIKEDYSIKEEYKDMTPKEILDLAKKRMEEQDEQLKEFLEEAKKGTQMAKEIQVVIKEQNKQIDQIHEDVDRTDSRMKKLTSRFSKFISRQSTCCMILILILELIVALAFYLWFFYY